MATTKKQTGLSIKRDGFKFECSWVKAETYTSQEFEYKINSGSWKSKDVGKLTTKLSVSLSASSYYPSSGTKINKFSFRVRAKANKKDKSSWTEKSITIYEPNKPTLTATPDAEASDKTKFEWAGKDTQQRPATQVRYQTQLTQGNAKPDWDTEKVNKSLTGSVTIRETSSALQSGSITRWVRVWTRGMGGYSDKVEKYRTYSSPNAPTNVATSVNVQSGGMQVKVEWSQQSDFANPTASSVAEYVIAVPGENMSAPISGWATLAQVTKKATYASGFVNQLLSSDECLFVRVVAKFQSREVSSGAVIALYGKLSAPEIVSVTPVEATHRATIEADNNSDVPGSFLVVQYRTKSNPSDILTLGVIPAGSSSATFQCPNWSGETAKEFGVYAAVGEYAAVTRADGVSQVDVTAKMKSAAVWQGGAVPQAPSNVSVAATSIEGTVRVTWDWDWADAQTAVISWADHEDAWESTDQPEEYTLNNANAGAWNVSGLSLGKRWYFRVKLVAGTGDQAISGAWSEAATIDLSVAPSIPVLSLSKQVVNPGGSFTASWIYMSNDGTEQAFAEICEASISGSGITYGTPIANTTTSQDITLAISELGWNQGETHYLCVRVVSGSGVASEAWSAPASIMVAPPLVAAISQTSLNASDELTAMPFTFTITGAGEGGTTTVAIIRTDAYHITRPDEREFNGYKDETIALWTQTGEAQISIGKNDLIGRLDDGARYTLVASVQDVFGQTDSVEKDFTVNWTHKAVMPNALALIDGNAAVLKPIEPLTGFAEGDTCDIYRLSADRPELVYSGAEFGEIYVDPYPAIGEFGGYRFVYRTFNDDYITTDRSIAWLDVETNLDLVYSLIDFPEGQIRFLYDVSHSNKWEKDFKKTRYLGGSIVGDWNKGVSRSGSMTGAVVTIKDQESMGLFRRLADYAGICHIRTVDGSSFDCNIQVNEDRRYDLETVRGTYSLDIDRVDQIEPAGVRYAVWFGEEEDSE